MFVLLSLGAAAARGVGDGELADDAQLWGNITATGSLARILPVDKHWLFWVEGQGRFGNDMSSLSQSMLRPGIGYKLSERGSVWFGYAHIHTDTPFAARPFDEHRLWQQFLWAQPLGPFSFVSRSRFEQRFANTGDDAALRFREFVKLSWPVPGLQTVSLVTWNEAFVNLSNADWGARGGLDQNRAFAGLGYAFTKNIKAELGYMNQYINRPTSPDRMSHVLGLTLLLNYPEE